MTDEYDSLEQAIAIVGMSGRFPGADDIAGFWKILRDGREGADEFPESADAGFEISEVRTNPGYVRKRGAISNVEDFDAGFFRMRPLEAKVMDPQQRIFLEVCAEALESAGCLPSALGGAIGVFATASENTYRERYLVPTPAVCEAAGDVAVRIGNDIDYLASSVAYRLNLSGPAVTLRTACSSSLVAIANGCRALLGFDCDAVLAGGVTVSVPQNSGYLHQPGSILSPDGHCRTFDENGHGTYFSNGAGVVLMKRLDDAIANGDSIYAVIRGSAVNNDGAARASFTAPNVAGQAEVVTMAQEIADVDPESISYVEAHGTATEVGDPIEIEALSQAFRRRTDKTGFCHVGALKSNFGHLDVTAGVAGLMKVALSLKHEFLPPSINFSSPNPKIDFASTPFQVITDGTAWPRAERPRRAGVSAFGTGGTNAHVVLEEAPFEQADPELAGERLLQFSARSEETLAQLANDLAEFLTTNESVSLSDVEHTLRDRRVAHEHRQFVVCDTAAAAARSIREKLSRFTGTRVAAHSESGVVMMFPGQGTQYPGMGSGVYQSDSVYRSTVDEGLDILEPILGPEFRSVVFAEDRESEEFIRRMTNTAYAQPAIFLVEFALAKTWLHRNVNPAAFIGHSVGEFVAACLAGVLSLKDAMELVALRGELMQAQPIGTMLSVRAPLDAIEEHLDPEVSIACVNSRSLVVLSGPDSAIERCKTQLEARDLVCRPLHTSHAFHSSMMEPILEPMRERLGTIALAAPEVPIMSTVSGEWLTQQQACDPEYWAQHALRTVQFSRGMQSLLGEGFGLFLECGTRTTLATLARQHFEPGGSQIAVASLGENMDADSERQALLRAVGDLWASGIVVETTPAGAGERRNRAVPLPTCPFQRQRHWVDLPERQSDESAGASAVVVQPTPPAGTEESRMAAPTQSRVSTLGALIMKVLGDTFGSDLSDTDQSVTFVELGFDSLFLTQVSGKLAKETGAEITFRQMLDDYPSPAELARYLDEVLPPESFQPEPAPAPPVAAAVPAPTGAQSRPAAVNAPLNDSGAVLHELLSGQLEVMRRQLEYFQNVGAGAPAAAVAPRALEPAAAGAQATVPASSNGRDTAADGKARPFGPMARVNKSSSASLLPEQQDYLRSLVSRYTEKTAASRESAQANRRHLADPRTVSGFHPLWKEIVYPIVTTGSSGSRLTDLDGNELIDVTNGFGTILLGHSPDIVVSAIAKQLHAGYETGPQTPLAGRAARLVTELTGHERAAFANTGSEAVLAAMRIARTCRSRDLIVTFSGSYHGIFDEVVIRGSNVGGSRRTLPAAPGIPPSALQNVVVLDYDDDESLAYIESNADQIAAVLTEPVQGGNPANLPVEFLKKLRKVTAEKDVLLIFDEVVTGFRVHPGGIQGLTGIQADIATYGKVCGGGMPIGIVAGASRFMDALDGGYWEFGDNSRPEANMTFFAGTFMRHPLALAACVAVLEHLKEAGPSLQSALNDKMEGFAADLNGIFKGAGLPMRLNHFSSFSRIDLNEELPYAGLLYYLLREKGVHIWEGRAVILTTAHTDIDLEFVLTAFRESIAELQNIGLLPTGVLDAAVAGEHAGDAATQNGHESLGAPVPGAVLGRTADGYPAWFIADPDSPGKYVQVGDRITAH